MTNEPVLAEPPDEQKLSAHLPTRRRLEAIGPPLDRFVKASEIANLCYRKNETMTALRQRRRLAVVALARFHGWNKAEIARHIGGEKQDRRVVDFAFGNKTTKTPAPDLRDIPAEWNDETLAANEAKRTHAAYLRREAMGTTAREMRRVLIWELTNGLHGRRYRNAELAGLIGNTPALVAQNRTGSSNRTKQANREAKRAAKRLKEEAEAEAA